MARSAATIVAVLLLLAMLPGASAAITTSYGDIVEKKTSTSQSSMVTFHSTTISIAQFKATNDGTVDWYLDVDSSGTTSVGDIRLNAVTVSGSFSVGTTVLTGNNDIGRTLPTSGVVCYVDTNAPAGSYYYRGDNRLNPPHPNSNFKPDGEPVYLMKNACGTVQTGQDQVRLTKAPSTQPNYGGAQAGSRITTGTSGSTDVGLATTALTASHVNAAVRFVDLDLSGGVSTADPFYLVTDGTTAVGPSPGDVRLWATSSTISFGSFPYGSYVDFDDFDTLYDLSALGAAQVRFNAEGSGATVPNCSSTSLQHDIWLDIDASGTVTRGDILLAKRSGSATNVTAGFPIRAGNTHLTTALSASLNGNLAYIDNNGDSVFNFGDNIYLDVGGGSADNKVSAGDVVLSTNSFSGSTAGSFGTCVTTGSQVNQPLVTSGFPPTFSYLSAWNDDSYQPGDLVYIGATQVTLGDVRWSGIHTSFGAIGTVVDDNDADRTYLVSKTGFTPAFCFVSSTGTTYRHEDSVYLATGSATCALTVRAGDVRISSGGSKAAGTAVEVGDSDFNSPLQQFGGATLKYAESSASQGSSSSFDPFDHVYLDVNGANAQVEVNDVRLSTAGGGSPGTKVRSTDSDLSDTLRDFPAAAGGAFTTARIGFVKALPATTGSTFSATYRFSDAVVYDTNNNGLVDLGDIWLSGSGGATTTTGGGGSSGGSGGGTTTPSNSRPVVIIECRGAVGETTVNVDGSKSYDPDGTIQSGSHQWTFGEGGTASGTTASHTYTSAGTFWVSLTVRDAQGVTGSSTYQVKVPLEQVDCRAPASPTPTESPAESPTETPAESPTGSPTTVPPTTPPTDEPPEDDDEGTPGFGLVGILAAFGLVAIAARRRR